MAVVASSSKALEVGTMSTFRDYIPERIEHIERDRLFLEPYQAARDLKAMMNLVVKDLSEPYTVYTYRFFINNWPEYTWIARYDGEVVGCVISKMDMHKTSMRGYIAMLAVDKRFRGHGIASALVQCVADCMRENGGDEVVLESEVTNKAAIALYEKLGFVRDKRLFTYYLNGADAYRLKLWLTSPYERCT
eukprot:Clim_evm54s236 gene=Clim_evmTU54s236